MKLKKKRIVFFIGEIGLGGTEKQLSILTKYFNKELFEFTLIVFNTSPFGNLTNQIFPHLDQLIFIPKKKTSIFSRLLYLFKKVKKINPFCIHSWSVHDNAYAGIIGKLLGVPVIIGSVRGSLKSTSFEKLPIFYKWISLSSVPKLVVNSKFLKNELILKGVDFDKIAFIPNCVEESQIINRATKNNTNIITTIGNLRENKNHEFFIEVMSIVIKRLPKTEGWIVGQIVADEPDYHKKLKQVINSNSMNKKIKLLGFQSDIKTILEKTSVFVLSSKSESSPNSILEALSQKVPVVASDVGGVSDIIQNKKNGFLISIDDKIKCAEIIIELLTNPEMFLSQIENGLKTIIIEHNPVKISKKFESLYLGN